MDPNDLNSLSEVESLSDSDWLDISSRASENDSDASDREDLESDYRPPSRRSVASTGSSREGEVQGWEGIVEDSADEALPAPVAVPAGTLTDPNLAHLSLSFRAAALSESAVARHLALVDPEEEQRVKDALDQSMVSTLSSSRSNSLNGSAVHTSVVHSRDMRLSFPDPLTSPRAESLSPSYEDISVPTDTDLSPSDGDTQPPSQSQEAVAASATPPAADPGATPTPEVARAGGEHARARTNIHSSRIIDFYIVFYGASSENKHRVVHRLLEKLMTATGCGFSALPQIDVPRNIRTLVNGGRTTHYIISVIDRTDAVLHGKEEPASFASHAEKPSLAIVFLPSAVTVVPEHTLYLPVLAQDTTEDDDDLFESSDRLLDAEHDWQVLGMPKSRTVSAFITAGKSSVVEEDDLERASPARVARAFRPLLPWTQAWSSQNLTSRHALTIFAILSIVLGYLINGSLSSASVGRPAKPGVTILPMRAQSLPSAAVVNISAAVPGPTSTGMALVSSSLKDFALAVLSPFPVASTSSVAAKALPSPTAAAVPDSAPEAGAPSECECGCGLITWPAKNKPSTDIALRPTPPSPSLAGQAFTKGGLSLVTPGASVKGKGKARASEDDSLYALSTRIAGALTEYIDTCINFGGAARNDVQEVVDALEELSQAIGRQTEEALEQTQVMVEEVRQTIRNRHERARERAKEIRAAGERWFSSVSEVSARVRDRVSLAKENARGLREAVVTRHNRREEARWVRKERREGRQERRDARRASRWERRADRWGRSAQPVEGA
ncbi:hypothetical protein TRAPUB_11999 [Trametes pubescens]|uniref:Uncharacterized protein n=1 Tax=Trametes pubescens TaxID=154538 RepID=A0A1M2VV20_TRAPU|nr:hypothetical protein TRAPUB_11999 [Trametes pubescens]